MIVSSTTSRSEAPSALWRRVSWNVEVRMGQAVRSLVIFRVLVRPFSSLLVSRTLPTSARRSARTSGLEKTLYSIQNAAGMVLTVIATTPPISNRAVSSSERL